jgi:site-specific recombinase XerC
LRGTVNAAIVGYYDSMMFFGSLAPSTQAIRRQILERFRTDHCDKPIALLPKRFIVLTIGKLKPSVATNWLSAIRHLMQYAVSANLCEVDPTQGIKLKTPKSDGIYTWS